jgi:hypothetical protein
VFNLLDTQRLTPRPFVLQPPVISLWLRGVWVLRITDQFAGGEDGSSQGAITAMRFTVSLFSVVLVQSCVTPTALEVPQACPSSASQRERPPPLAAPPDDLHLVLEDAGEDGRHVRVTFQNTGLLPFWIDYRAYAYLPDEKGVSLSFDVRAADGSDLEPLRFECKVKQGPPLPESLRYLWLTGGGSYSYVLGLHCYGPVYDSTLLVTARFHDTREPGPQFPPGDTRFVGSVTSNTLVLEWKGVAGPAPTNPAGTPEEPSPK